LWIVAKTQAGREAWAGLNIERQGYSYYLPVFSEIVLDKRRQKVEKTRCLFPRYIFVETDGCWHFLTGTFGVTGVLLEAEGEGPATVPKKVIDQLRARQDSEGRVILPEAPKRFLFGQKVTVTEGPFSGHIGIYQGATVQQRKKVLLDLLGRRTQILIQGDALAAA